MNQLLRYHLVEPAGFIRVDSSDSSELSTTATITDAIKQVLPQLSPTDQRHIIGHTTISPLPGTTLGFTHFVARTDGRHEQSKRSRHSTRLAFAPLPNAFPIHIFDSPGVINDRSLHSSLQFDELRHVMSRSTLHPITYRLQPGQSLLLGALGKIDCLPISSVPIDKQSILCTIFVSEHTTIHITKSWRVTRNEWKQRFGDVEGMTTETMQPESNDSASVDTTITNDGAAEATSAFKGISTDDAINETFDGLLDDLDEDNRLIRSQPQELDEDESLDTATRSAQPPLTTTQYFHQHVGRLLSPPFTPERFDELGLEKAPIFTFELAGRGWLESCDDIVFPGLGWVAITCSGTTRLRAQMAGSAVPVLRKPLRPYDVRFTKRKYFGISPFAHRP